MARRVRDEQTASKLSAVPICVEVDTAQVMSNIRHHVSSIACIESSFKGRGVVRG